MPEIAVFDHYEVLTKEDGSLFELGRGAMGITYKAFDTRLRIPVALKVINSAFLNSDVARQRFLREARSAARLRHRHVATVFHLGSEADTWFYAMEFIDGETVEGLIKRNGPLAPGAALRITAQVARALNAAAQHGLVHRDIKPSNLMLVREDDELVAKVIDFGLAKISAAGGGDDAATLSMGGFVGTFAFASPEQLEEREIDSRSDIYSLGITLWYMLAGQVPFVGPMMQVVNQHLSTPPPFEKFEHLPPSVEGVLRKMLEKDRANRFQTPLELRTALEACLDEISDEPAVISTPSGDESLAVLLDDASKRAGDTQFEIGVILARHYRITEVLGEINAGRVFRAADTVSKCDVCVLVLQSKFRSDAAACTTLEREVEKLLEIQHPNLLRIRAFETVDQASFVVMEWTNGFSLLDLLRARRELSPAEVNLLLEQAVVGVDYALKLGLVGLAFDLRQMLLHFPEPFDKAALLQASLTEWPKFELKFYPLAIAMDASSSQTWAGAQTMVGGAPNASKEADQRPRYLQSLAATVYELLGGARPPSARGGHLNVIPRRYAPLSTLSEEGNEILKRALDPARSFESAKEFFIALSTAAQHSRRQDSKARKSSPAPPSGFTVPTPATVPTPRKPKRSSPALLVTIAASVLTIVASLIALYLHSQGDGVKSTTQSTVADDSNADANRPSVSAATPATPDRQAAFAAATKSAQELEKKGDWAKSAAGWVRVAKDFPEADAPKKRLESILKEVAQRPRPLSKEEFASGRAAITDAAQLDVVSAMILLGDNLRDQDPGTALKWYSTAAAKGYAPALTRAGLMVWSGSATGTPDFAKAVPYFRDAAAKGDPAGSLALAECYLAGKGVPAKDEKRALQLFRDSAGKGNSIAMNRLADCLVHGTGGKTDFAEAIRLFGQASESGNTEALGNLGVLYLNGDGVPANPKKGAELLEKGANAGNGLCMFFLARCFENGIGEEKNPSLAQNWYSEAAKAGDKRAAQWCQQRGIPLAPR